MAKKQKNGDGSIVLAFRTAYSDAERAAMEEDVKTMTERIALTRKELTALKARLRRKSASERVRVRVDLETMKVIDTATGEQIHPGVLTPGQWKQAIAAAKGTTA